MTPFLQSTQAQGVIDKYLKGDLDPKPNVNSAGVFRNPNFDLRTEQENAGTLDPSALYPNPQIDFSVDDEEIIDPCQEGYMLVDGICQPIETFGRSAYDKQRDDNPDDPPREYYSIEDMKKMDDYEFLNYLTGAGAYMTGEDGQFTLNDPMNMGLFTMGMDALFGNSRQLRNDFMRKKLAELGYNFTNNKDGEPVYNLLQPMNIISNAQAANQGGNKLATNQVSIFTPDEINYQIDAKNKAQNIVNQGGNAYGQSFSGNAQQIHDQVVADAIQSGGTVNPFEAQNINAGGNNNSTVSSPPTNVGNPFGYNNKPKKPPFLS
jgi:hypothetical protein